MFLRTLCQGNNVLKNNYFMKKNKIKELYEGLGLNLNQFAKRIDYKHSTIIKIEDGTIKTLSPKLRKAITTAFPQVNPEWLETGQGDMLLANEVSSAVVVAAGGYIDLDAAAAEALPTEPDIKKMHHDYVTLTEEEKWYVRSLVDIFQSGDAGIIDAIKPNLRQFTRVAGKPGMLELLESYDPKHGQGPPKRKAGGEKH